MGLKGKENQGKTLTHSLRHSLISSLHGSRDYQDEHRNQQDDQQEGEDRELGGPIFLTHSRELEHNFSLNPGMRWISLFYELTPMISSGIFESLAVV